MRFYCFYAIIILRTGYLAYRQPTAVAPRKVLLGKELTMSTSMLGRPGENLLGIVEDFVTKLNNGTIAPWQAKKFLRKEDPWACPMDTQSQLECACILCAEAFGISVDPASVKIPERQAGRDRLIVIPKGLTMNQITVFFRTKFTVYLYTEDLDGDVTKNDRKNDETYAIWVQDVVEADEELKGLSANDLAEKKIPGVTLMECLLHEALYFGETGKHLDIQNWTLCSASRRSDGRVPDVYWSTARRELHVNWSNPDRRYDSLRARAVVALPAAA